MKVIGTLVIAVGLVAVGNAQDQNKKELDKLQGTWKIQNAKIAGKDYPAKSLVAQTITFSGETITCKEIKGTTAKAVVDSTKMPPVVMLYAFKSDTLPQVWKLWLIMVVSFSLCVPGKSARQPSMASWNFLKSW
jgi:uncharacterized protein (TIGR03067 family)